MRRSFVAAVGPAAVGCLWVAAAFGQETPPVFQSTTELVILDVQVLNARTGTATASLRSGDLRVFEDGTGQQISYFSRDEMPLSVVLLFDLTDSVRGVLRKLAGGAASALTHFRPQDEVAVMTYAAEVHLVDGFTRDRDKTVRAIEEAASSRTTDQPAHFNEAMYQAAMQLGQSSSPSNRRVVIWLTDNFPNVPFRTVGNAAHTEKEALRALHEQSVAVAPILMKDLAFLPMAEMMSAFEAPWRKSYPPGDAHKYAELTGGVATGLRGKNADERLAELIDELRARYTVGYKPSESKPAGAFCKLRVELAADGALRPREWKVLARQGYYRK